VLVTALVLSSVFSNRLVVRVSGITAAVAVLAPGAHAVGDNSQQWRADALVEGWFSELTNKKPRRGAYRSVRALNADIRA
jgi:hypothetical protein